MLQQRNRQRAKLNRQRHTTTKQAQFESSQIYASLVRHYQLLIQSGNKPRELELIKGCLDEKPYNNTKVFKQVPMPKRVRQPNWASPKAAVKPKKSNTPWFPPQPEFLKYSTTKLHGVYNHDKELDRSFLEEPYRGPRCITLQLLRFLTASPQIYDRRIPERLQNELLELH